MDNQDIISTLQSKDFEAFADRDWEICVHETIPSIKAKLVNVLEHLPGEGITRNGFSLTFETDLKEKYYPQGTYQLIHPEKGSLILFMVPVGPSPQGFIQYEIVFN